MQFYPVRKLISLGVLLISCMYTKSACAQLLNVDSIQSVIETTKNDAIKTDAMQAYAGYLITQKLQDEKAISLLNESMKLAEKNNYFFAIANAYNIFTDFYFFKSDWAKSIASAQTAIKAAANIKDANRNKKILYQANVNIAENYAYNGDFTESLDYRLKAISIIESTEDNFIEKGEVYVGAMNDFRHLKQYSKAEQYVKKAEPIFDKMDVETKFNFMYEYYQDLLFFSKIDEATALLKKYDEALDVYPLSNQAKIDFTSLSKKLHGQFEMSYTKNYKQALYYFKGYLDLSIEGKDKAHIGIALNKMANAYDSLHDYPNAIATFKAAYDTAMIASSYDYAFKNANEAAMIYQKMGDYKEAMYYNTLAAALKDTLDHEEKLKELNFLEARYEASQKEKQIANLTVTNTQKELEVIKRNRLLLVAGIGVAALLLVMGLFYRNVKTKQVIGMKEQKIKEAHIKFLEGQQQVISLQSMLNGQETERTRIAKDLHDGLGGLFSTIKMYFSTLQHEQPLLKINSLFGKSYKLIDTASEEVRRIAHNMMPEVLMKLGLVQAVQDICHNINAGKLLQVKLLPYGMEKRMNISTEIMLYRIIQELLNNIIKHAQATEAIVQFNRNAERLTITVEDNGRGFNMQEADDKKHAGLETIKSRITYLNGNISIDSQKEIGTTVMMEFLIHEAG
ncbi:MAG: sensor histidine kinase [Ferruginibacter sp.]